MKTHTFCKSVRCEYLKTVISKRSRQKKNTLKSMHYETCECLKCYIPDKRHVYIHQWHDSMSENNDLAHYVTIEEIQKYCIYFNNMRELIKMEQI